MELITQNSLQSYKQYIRSCKRLETLPKSTFQQDRNDLDLGVHILKWPSQSLALNPIENPQQDIKIDVKNVDITDASQPDWQWALVKSH